MRALLLHQGYSMGWILGFGIPISYIVAGFYTSRAAYRSRHKRGLNSYGDDEDTMFLCILMTIIWPVLAPPYFFVVHWGKAIKHKVISFYKHNLPETNKEKERRLEHEAREAKAYIDRLEREMEVGPYKKDLI